jgi:hypothetical protein
VHLFNWIPWPARFRTLRVRKPLPDGKLHCAECGGGIHRHDRYEILTARHRDCVDPRMVGQKSLLPPSQSSQYVKLDYIDADGVVCNPRNPEDK